MKLLLDTCTYIWLVDNSALLSAAAREALRTTDHSRHLSAISVSEVHRLIRKGRLAIHAPRGLDVWFETGFANHGVAPEAITWRIAHAAEMLPAIHNDPADRYIIATAQRLDAAIVTPDNSIPRYPGVEVIW